MNFNDEDIDSVPDPNTLYKCSQHMECSGMTYLMKLCMMTNKYSQLNDKIGDYLSKNREETVKLLLEKGADVNLQDRDGWTALMCACGCSDVEITGGTIKLLLENNADVDLQDNIGRTALMLATLYSNTRFTEGTIKLLLEKDADVNLQNNNNWTALMYASLYSGTRSTEGTVKLLLENNANVNSQDSRGWTALMIASSYSGTCSTEGTVKLLLEQHIKKEHNLISIIVQIQSIQNYDPLNEHIKKLIIVQHNKAKFI